MEVPELAVRQVGGDGQTQDRGAPETDVHLIDIGPILEYCREAGGDECECARQKPAYGRDRALVVPLEDGVEMILLDRIPSAAARSMRSRTVKRPSLNWSPSQR